MSQQTSDGNFVPHVITQPIRTPEDIVSEYEKTKSLYQLGSSYIRSGEIYYTNLNEIRQLQRTLEELVKECSSKEPIDVQQLCLDINLLETFNIDAITQIVREANHQKDLENPNQEYKKLIDSFLNNYESLHDKSDEFKSITYFNPVKIDELRNNITDILKKVYSAITEICEFLEKRENKYQEARQCLEYKTLLKEMRAIQDKFPASIHYNTDPKSVRIFQYDLDSLRSLIHEMKRILTNVTDREENRMKGTITTDDRSQ